MSKIISIEKLLDEWDQDCIINKQDLSGDTINTARLHAKYLRHLTYAKMIRSSRQKVYDELRTKKWEYYNGRMSKAQIDELGWPYDPFHGGAKPLKGDLQRIVDSDSELADIKSKLEKDTVAVEVLEEIIGTLRWRSNSIKNIIENEKFQAGC